MEWVKCNVNKQYKNLHLRCLTGYESIRSIRFRADAMTMSRRDNIKTPNVIFALVLCNFAYAIYY